MPWSAADIAAADSASLEPILAVAAEIELLLVGTGGRMLLLPEALREACRASGLAVEAMDTGAACRTYNVLAEEQRRIAAALIALS